MYWILINFEFHLLDGVFGCRLVLMQYLISPIPNFRVKGCSLSWFGAFGMLYLLYGEYGFQLGFICSFFDLHVPQVF
jgi:hypothetical protein